MYESLIVLTFATKGLIGNIKKWKVLEGEGISYYKQILFDVARESGIKEVKGEGSHVGM